MVEKTSDARTPVLGKAQRRRSCAAAAAAAPFCQQLRPRPRVGRRRERDNPKFCIDAEQSRPNNSQRFLFLIACESVSEPAVATLRPCSILWQFPSSETIHHHRNTIHSWPSSTPVTILCHLETTPVRKLYLSQPQLSHSHSHMYPQTESGI